MRQGAVAGAVFFTLCFQGDLVFGSEIMSSADAFDTGAWRVSFYGRHVMAEPIIETSGGGTIQVPISGGGTTGLFAQTNAEVEMESEFNAAIAALTFRPRDGLHYRFKVGQLRNYQVSFASGSDTNTLRSETDGLVWGAGVRWNATQGSIVSVAFAIDFSFTQSIVDFDRFQSGATTAATNQRFEQDEYQVAFNLSRRWKQIEPYGGLKVGRVISRLKDRSSKSRVRGEDETISPFIGLNFFIFDGEAITLEGSFLDEESFNAGFNIQF